MHQITAGIRITDTQILEASDAQILATVEARILNIQIQNPFEIWTFWYLDLGWFGIRMIGTVATAIAIVQIIQKQNQYIGIQDGAYLVGFGMVGLFSSGMQFNIQTTFNHSKLKKCIWDPTVVRH